MAECRQYLHDFTDGNGQTFHVYYADDHPLENCESVVNARVILTPSEYATSSSTDETALVQLFETYFAFDKDLFLELQGYMLLSWVVGFGIGKVIDILNISNKVV